MPLFTPRNTRSTNASPAAGAPPRSRRRRRLLTGALALAVAAGVLSGCAPTGPENVRFYLSKPEAIPYFRELVKTYNAEQNRIHVTLDTSANLQAGFLRGNPPDLGLLNYNMEMSRFMERGALSDLGDMPEASHILPDVQKLVDQYATYRGRTSVLPYSVMAASVIYNKQIFAEQGIAIPQTWAEFQAACEKLTAAGITPIYGTFKDPWTVAQGWFDYAVGGMVNVADFYAGLNKEGTDVGAHSAVSFQKSLLEPTQRMQEIAQKYTNKDAAAKGYGDGNLAFAQGKAAMYFQGPWALGEIAKTAPDLQLGTFPLPMTDNPQDLKVRVNIDLAAWIPEASKHQKAAREFLTYLFQPSVIDDYNAKFLGYGTTTDAAPVTDPRIVGMREYYDRAAFYQGASKAIPLTIPTENYVQGIVLGADPKSTLATLDADWARLALRR
ncbi:ABC transporter substrate-binding protein [Mycetocola saprophilus]|uniref:ABC transporter substrate-binding protein n=1 Tax=Mycetocola saprophilus TaxID=76636 RepID=UPI000AF3DBCE